MKSLMQRLSPLRFLDSQVEAGLVLTDVVASCFKEEGEVENPVSSAKQGSFSPHQGQNLKSG